MKEVKPGYKSTEFYLSALASIVGLLFASGLVESGTAFDQVLGFIAMALTAMGYSVSRGIAKK